VHSLLVTNARAGLRDLRHLRPNLHRARNQSEAARAPVRGTRYAGFHRGGARAREEASMAQDDLDSMVGLFRSLLDDTRALFRDELDLMRAEVREDMMNARAAGLAFGGAAVAAVLAVGLLSLALAGALACVFGWPAWAGYGVLALLLLVGAWIGVVYGRKRMAGFGELPKTRESLKENLSWLQDKAATK
jgi:hypothetical protein